MKSPLNRTTLIIGSVILALVVVDGLIQQRSMSGLHSNLFQHIRPDSVATVFFLGLTVGMMTGIGIFFTHLMWRKKAAEEDARGLDLFLEEIALVEDDDISFSEDSMVDEKAELSDPWERPADWWMNADDD